MTDQLHTIASSGLALHEIGDLAGLLSEQPKEASGYAEIDINLIDEDPAQPRTEFNHGFSTESIAELAGSIDNSGLLQPITIRKHPEFEGRYMIKDGARRFRASKQNGAEKIAAIIEDEGDKTAARVKIEQLIVNLQKEGNTPLEIAHTIATALEEGIGKKTISSLIGKSPAWVTLHTTLLKLPAELDAAYKAGKVTDVNIIYELNKLYKTNQADVMAWLDTPGQEFTRGQLKLFQEYLKDKKENIRVIQDANNEPIANLSEVDEDDLNSGQVSGTTLTGEDESNIESGGRSLVATGDDQLQLTDSSSIPNNPDLKQQEDNEKKKIVDPSKFKKAIVQIWHDGRPGRIILDKRPSTEGFGHIKYDDDGHELEVDLGEVKLLALVEA
jgi:ParB family chromosome partitioning protein